MKRTVPNDLGLCLVKFFQIYLPSLRGMSTPTIRSYRDALVLFLRFAASRTSKHSDQIDLDDFTAQYVTEFVTFLEQARHNCIGTRNVRLAAIHTFARFAATAAASERVRANGTRADSRGFVVPLSPPSSS